MNKTIEVLDSEHRLISKVIDKAKIAIDEIKKGNSEINGLLQYIDFFREYADKYHHNKEEKILFPEMVKRNEILEFGVIQEMMENHEDFREMLEELEEHIKNNDLENTEKKFNEYTEALLEHIAVEDEEVFQIAETLLSENELETIFYLFQDSDRELGENIKSNWTNILL